MQTILFITDLHIGAQITKIAGVFARARQFGWRVVEIERNRTARPLSDFFAIRKPIGCIMECSDLTAPPKIISRDTPTVFLDPDPKTLSRPCHAVVNDAKAIASLAADELIAAGCKSFAFVGWRERTGWSVSRAEAFRDVLAAKGFGCTILDEPWSEELELQKRLATQLPHLPRRGGIFAASDYVARQVASALDIAEMDSPRDAALIGVDNDELICENQVPTLSSISIDFIKAGRLATDLLAEVIGNPKMKPRRLAFGPLALVRRQSTRIVNSNDWRIVRAVERIRRDACIGLKAADVIAETGLSRRLVERRFLAATGRTIHEEITEIRFAHACQLLRDPSIPIGYVAEQCGWESDSYLKRLFKSRTGMTPRQWRRDALKDLI